MDKQEQREYIKEWKANNKVYLSKEFGMEDSPQQFSFLLGILFATSTSKHLVPLAQDLIQADGAHCEYGKYTLFSAYVTTANGNMSPIAFGLLFGNEDTDNWSKFWLFVKKIHPCVNAPAKTIMTDQDKGVIASILEILPEAAQFHCSFHRIQNIIKKCGGRKGAPPLSALWMYKKLSSATLWRILNKLRLRITRKCIQPTFTILPSCLIRFNILQQDAPWVTTFVCIRNRHHLELSL